MQGDFVKEETSMTHSSFKIISPTLSLKVIHFPQSMVIFYHHKIR